MSFGKMLLQRFGLFAQKSETLDTFGLRLQRMGSREARLRQQRFLFRSTLQPAEV